MDTNMTGFRWFQKSLRHCALDGSSLSIWRDNQAISNLDLYVGLGVTNDKVKENKLFGDQNRHPLVWVDA